MLGFACLQIALVHVYLLCVCVCVCRAAFVMGMLAEKKSDLDLAEALHLEAVLVLDRLPEVRHIIMCFIMCSGCARLEWLPVFSNELGEGVIKVYAVGFLCFAGFFFLVLRETTFCRGGGGCLAFCLALCGCVCVCVFLGNVLLGRSFSKCIPTDLFWVPGCQVKCTIGGSWGHYVITARYLWPFPGSRFTLHVFVFLLVFVFVSCFQEETGTCPLITPFGVNCLEKLGDVLLKNGKLFPLVFFLPLLARRDRDSGWIKPAVLADKLLVLKICPNSFSSKLGGSRAGLEKIP